MTLLQVVVTRHIPTGHPDNRPYYTAGQQVAYSFQKSKKIFRNMLRVSGTYLIGKCVKEIDFKN